MNKKYTISGRQIFSNKGKLVATLDENNNPIMCLGMAGAHTRGVQEFLSNNSLKLECEAPPEEFIEEVEFLEPVDEKEVADSEFYTLYVGIPPLNSPVAEKNYFEREKTLEEWEIDTIPAEQLPVFNKEYGINTPGFLEWVKKHNLSNKQITALVKRLEK